MGVAVGIDVAVGVVVGAVPVGSAVAVGGAVGASCSADWQLTSRRATSVMMERACFFRFMNLYPSSGYNLSRK